MKKTARRKTYTRRGEAVGKPSRPVMGRSFGQGLCLYCHRPFEKTKASQRYDTDYCRSMHWQAQYRRKAQPEIVSVDGKPVEPFKPGDGPEGGGVACCTSS